MINKYQKKYSLWIDLVSPEKEEIEEVAYQHKINESISRDLLSPTPKHKVEVAGDKLYAVLHIPVLKHSHNKNSNRQEIDFVIGRKLLITAHYDSIDALYTYAKKAEVGEILEALFDEVSSLEDRSRNIEAKIFSGHEKEMVKQISELGRDILSFRRIIEPHGEMFAELKILGADILGRKFSTEVEELIGEWQRLCRLLENNATFLTELRETNNSMLTTKQNETMKVLAIISFVMFPLTLVAALFSLNTDYIPLVGREGDFWYVIGIMSVMTLCMFIFFKIRKWL
jgi:magnesium transporter